MDQTQTPVTGSSEVVNTTWKKKVAVFMVGQTITTFGSFLVQYAIFWHLT